MIKNTKQPTNRRKAVKILFSASGATLLGAQLPTQWTKPVVESILMPAHAQTSISIAQNPDPLCGSNQSLSIPVSITFTISPNPGAGATVSVTASCNGAASTSGTFSTVTAADGSVSLSGTGASEGCVAGDTLGLSLSYSGVTSACSWTMT